jgi:hypothetical protein
MTQGTALKQHIMRRVYYAYAISIFAHPVTAYTAALVVAGWWLKELVFVANIWNAFVSTPIGELGTFAVNVLQGADTLTLLVLAAAIAFALGFMRSVQRLKSPVMLAI